ncbi:MAG: DNA primase [Anaerolineae bacterium 49_20]|nr:MAG: DNA primase [Anaerolineae bacterium 49_20]
MSVVDEVKAQLDIVDIVSQTVKLRRTGKNYIGFCPFHPNTRTPAFVVFPDSQTWRCFGACNEGGDIFSFVMKREGWDFADTLRYLAEKAGVQLTPRTAESSADESRKEALQQVLEEAVQFFRRQMLESDEGRQALDYLHQRGLSDETIKIWGLGYAPSSWNALGSALQRKGYNQGLLESAGLITLREDGTSYDRFRQRLMFPIRDTYGKMAGFGGRILFSEDKNEAKYVNSPRTELFDKGRLLYGLDMARREIRKSEQAVIVEGYMDVIGLHQAGFHNAISPMGTALTEDQFTLLKKFSRNIILALDPDAAGKQATLRGLETARQTLDQEAELRFDAHGLLHVEARLRADIRVTTLPEGKDPDEIVLSDPQAWAQIVAKAKPVVVHVMETLAASRDLEDAKVKREIAAQVLPLIEDVPDPIEREAYREQLARLLRVDVRALLAAAPQKRQPRRSRGVQQQTTSSPEVSPIADSALRNRLLEKEALQALLRDPESLYRLNRSLGLLGLEPFSEADFIQSDFRQGFKLVRASLEQDLMSPKEYLEENLPEGLEEKDEPPTMSKILPPSEEKHLTEQVRTVLRIRRNVVQDRIQEIQFLQSEVEEKAYSEEEAQILLLELLNQRRILDLALQSPLAGGTSLSYKPSRGT